MVKFLDPEWKSGESGTGLPSQHLQQGGILLKDAQLGHAQVPERGCIGSNSQLAVTSQDQAAADRLHWFLLWKCIGNGHCFNI